MNSLFKKLMDFKVRDIFLAGLCLLTLLFVGSSAINVLCIHDLIEETREITNRQLTLADGTAHLEFGFANYNSNLKWAILADDPQEYRDYRDKAQRYFHESLGKLKVIKGSFEGEKNHGVFARLTGEISQLEKLHHQIMSELEASHFQNPRPSFMKIKMKQLSLLKEWKDHPTVERIEMLIRELSDLAVLQGKELEASGEREADETLWETLGFLIFSLTLAGIIFFVLLKTIIGPIGALHETCRQLATGRYSARVPVEGESEIGGLARSFNIMLDEVDRHEAALQSLLKGVNIGLFFFEPNGGISPEKSPFTYQLFPDMDRLTSIHQFFGQYSRESGENIKTLIERIWEGKEGMDFTDYTDLLPDLIFVPQEGSGELKVAQLKYRTLTSKDGQLHKIIVAAYDKSDEARVQRELDQQVERIQRITVVAANIQGYYDFQDSVFHLFTSLTDSVRELEGQSLPQRPLPETVAKVKDLLHTLKGFFSVYNFRTCVHMLHELEDQIAASETREALAAGGRPLSLQLDLFFQRVHGQMKDIHKTLGLEERQGAVGIPLDKYENLRREILRSGSTQLRQIARDLDQCPIQQIFKKYESYASHVASLLNKSVTLEYLEGSDPLSHGEAKLLDPVLCHLIRNSIGHGIEDPDLRQELGKDAKGKIFLGFFREESGTGLFVVRDDGQGINPDLVVQQALEKRLWSLDKAQKASWQDKVDLIFHPGVSTAAASPGLISGRGLGMSLTRSHLQEVKGSIKIETQKNHGTTFEIRVPLAGVGERMAA